MHCPCSYCQRSSFNALRRRNPDDLETLEKIAEAISLYKQGLTVVEISRRTGVFREKVSAWVAHLKVGPESELTWQEALKLLSEKYSKEEIGERVGLRPRRIYALARYLQLPGIRASRQRGKKSAIEKEPSLNYAVKEKLVRWAEQEGAAAISWHDGIVFLDSIFSHSELARGFAQITGIKRSATSINSWITQRTHPTPETRRAIINFASEVRNRYPEEYVDNNLSWKDNLKFLMDRDISVSEKLEISIGTLRDWLKGAYTPSRKNRWLIKAHADILREAPEEQIQTWIDYVSNFFYETAEWTIEEIAILKEYFNSDGVDKVKTLLPHKSKMAIRGKARKLGIIEQGITETYLRRYQLYDQGLCDLDIAKSEGLSKKKIITEWRIIHQLPPICEEDEPRDIKIKREHQRRLELYLQGLTDSEIGKRLGATREAIREWRIRYGFKPHRKEISKKTPRKRVYGPRKPRKPRISQLLTSEQKANIRNKYKAGGALSTIAKETGLSIKTITSLVRDLIAKKKQVIKLAKAGNSADVISQQIDVDIETIMTWTAGVRQRLQEIAEIEIQIAELYEQGLNDVKIAEQLQIDRGYVLDWRKKHKLPSNRMQVEKYASQIEPLYNQGMNDIKIGKILGIPRTTVWSWRKKHGLPPNARGRPIAGRLRRRNPDDLERLEKIGEARRSHNPDDLKIRIFCERCGKKVSVTQRHWLTPCSECKRRRNPDDLERLEKIAKARKIYRETGSVRKTSEIIKVKRQTIADWVRDLLPPRHTDPLAEAQVSQIRELYLKLGSISKVHKQTGIGKERISKIVEDLRDRGPTKEELIKKAREIYSKTRILRTTKQVIDKLLEPGRGIALKTISKWVADVKEDKVEWEAAVDNLLAKGYVKRQLSLILSRKTGCKFSAAQQWFAKAYTPRSRQIQKSIVELDKELAPKKNGKISRSRAEFQQLKTQAKALYIEGYSNTEIAKKLKVPHVTIWSWTKKFTRRRNPDDLETLAKMVEARRLYKQLGNYKKVAEIMGLKGSYHKVAAWVADLLPEKSIPEQQKEIVRGVYQETGSVIKAMRAANTSYYKAKEWIADLTEVAKAKAPSRDPRYEEVRRVFLETQNYTETARRVGVHKRTVRKWVADLVSSPVGRYSQTQKERVINLCKDLDLSYVEISRLSGVSESIVSKICRDANIRKKQIKSEREGRIIPGLQEARVLHQQGVRMPEISRRLSIKPVTVRSWKRRGWLRRRNPDDLETLEKIAEARRIYRQGVNRWKIITQLGVSYSTLDKWLGGITYVDPRIEEARELFRQGVGKWKIATQLRISFKTLNKWLTDLLPDPSTVDPRIQQARELYQRGTSKKQIKEQIGVGDVLLNQWLEGIESVDPRIQQARELYQQGVSQIQIIKRLHTSRASLVKWLEGMEFVDPRIQQARELYQQGVSKTQIKKRVKVGDRLLNYWLRQRHLRRRNPDEAPLYYY